jgi:hypothetical protein
VANPLPKPIVFQLSGVPENYGVSGWPLALHVNGVTHIIDLQADMIEPNMFVVAQIIRDEALFRFARDGEAVTVEPTEKGRQLLQRGASISFCFDLNKYW